MDFFSSLLVSIAMFFGFGQSEMEVEPIAVSAESTVQSETSQADGNSAPGVVEEIEEEVESMSPGSEPIILEDNEVISKEDKMAKQSPSVAPDNIQTMIVAGGCFWCVESDLEKVHGVISVVSGYSGGSTENPTYKNYGSGGHREVVEVTYDANQVSFENILIVTMKTTDPTDDDGTFYDRGDKYSAAFYYENDNQKQVIDSLIAEVDEHGPYDKPLAIDVEPRADFWPAEDYHQDYYRGTLSKLKYQYYRNGSGRDDFIEKYWGENDHSPELPWRTEKNISNKQSYMWTNYQKPDKETLKEQLDELTYEVTQEEGTEKADSSPLDKNYEPGIYVDVLSGEPLYSSKDKFDSGTGWPSFVRPITNDAVVELEDKRLFTTRTEIRSAIGDNHLGHVFDDGPKDSTGLRYCMNGAALKFIPKAEMSAAGYDDFLQYVE